MQVEFEVWPGQTFLDWRVLAEHRNCQSDWQALNGLVTELPMVTEIDQTSQAAAEVMHIPEMLMSSDCQPVMHHARGSSSSSSS